MSLSSCESHRVSIVWFLVITYDSILIIFSLCFFKVDFDAEDDGDDDVPIKMMKKSLLDGSDGMNKDGITALEGLDGMLENDKLSVSPLVIDGLEVDREVRHEVTTCIVNSSTV